MSLIPLIVTLIINIILSFNDFSFALIKLTPSLTIYFANDGISKFFALIISIIWIIVAIYSYEYLKHEANERKFYCYFLITLGMLMVLSYSGNLITMYLGFELVTLVSLPLVFISKEKEAIQAGLKYLYYSLGGAFLGLIGIIYFINVADGSTNFVLGGFIAFDKITNNNLFQTIILISLIGFSVKCGLFPLHGWLPSAHANAISPASSILSGIITKAGVLVVIRIIYYTIGVSYLKGTWVQYVYVCLILFTILLGSCVALIQRNFKKRLAYSSISQISYILLGIALMNEDAFAGSLIHIVAHASIKVCLFLVAGVIIYYTDKHNVEELDGIGKELPLTMVCYTLVSLGLIGIPPFGGFMSKWFIASGALDSSLSVLDILSVVILLISAIVTAAYLLPISIRAFIPKNKEVTHIKQKESLWMIIPLISLVIIALLSGVFSQNIISFAKSILEVIA
jgi:multicomponent Na+:H+ antiporter subunit D